MTKRIKFKRKAVTIQTRDGWEPIKEAARIEKKRFIDKVTLFKDPKRMSRRVELESTIRMYLAEWCVDYPGISPEEYLRDHKKVPRVRMEELFILVPRWQWIERQAVFASEVVRRITLRGVERVALEYDGDLKMAQKAKLKILDIMDKGKIKQSIKTHREDGKLIEEITNKRLPLEPIDFRSLAGAYETLQKITDRSLGITDNNREAMLENIKAKEREVKEKSDEGVKKIKQLSYEDAKDLIAMRREARANEEKSKKESQG